MIDLENFETIEKKENVHKTSNYNRAWMKSEEYRKKRSMIQSHTTPETWPGYHHNHRNIGGYKRIGVFVDGVEKNMLEHRYIWIMETGISLSRNELLHHIDGNRKNNDIRNLAKLTISEHMQYHKNYSDINISTLIEFLLDDLDYKDDELNEIIPTLSRLHTTE